MYCVRRSRCALILIALLWITSAGACAAEPNIEAFVAEEPSEVFGSVSAPDHWVIFLTHQKSLEWIGVVFGDVILLHYRDESRLVDAHRGRLSSSHTPGYVSESEFLFAMKSSDTNGTELCYLDFEEGAFRIFPVPARYIGAMVIWDDKIFYSTEHFDDNIHYVDIDDGEVHMVEGSGETAMNSDFWIIDGDLIVTDGGDKGIPYRLDTHGLYPAPDVAVSEETKVGFNLRTIRGGEDLERFEELLGIR